MEPGRKVEPMEQAPGVLAHALLALWLDDEGCRPEADGVVVVIPEERPDRPV